MAMKSLKKIYSSWLAKWGIALLIFTISRLLFYFFNHSYFGPLTFSNLWGGLRYDWMTISILYLPFLFGHLIDFRGNSNVLRWLFHISNTSAILFNCLDLEYFKFTYKRTTADLFLTSGIENDIFNLLPSFIIDYWYVILIAIALIWFSDFLYRKSMQKDIEWPGILLYLLFFIPAFTAYVIGFRGGVQYRPLNVIQAGQYAKAQNIPIVLNTPFTILKSVSKSSLEKLNYFSEDELNQHFTSIQKLSSDSSFQSKNVVLIIAESFSKEYIGAFNPNEESYTPFLDSLIGKSAVVENAYANGKKSIEALPAILSGIPTLMNTAYISSKYASNQIESIGSKLNDKNYRTVFYHGGENGTMGFDAYTQMAGIKEYIGKNEYPYDGDYDGHWGIFDEPFLQFCVEDLSKGEKPFFASIFTLSSHHPYTVPEQYKDRFKGGPLPILKSVEYADYALQQFFKAASKEVWFNNTLFVITADHTSQSFRESYNNRIDMYAIPLIFYSPNGLETQKVSKVGQQTDIYPSILDYLNYDGKYLAYGQSVFSNNEGYAISYINQLYQLVEGNYCLHFDGEESVGFYEWTTDPKLEHNLIGNEKHQAAHQAVELKLKGILQSYTHRINNNQLTTP